MQLNFYVHLVYPPSLVSENVSHQWWRWWLSKDQTYHCPDIMDSTHAETCLFQHLAVSLSSDRSYNETKKWNFMVKLSLTSLCLYGDIYIGSTKTNGVIFYNYFCLLHIYQVSTVKTIINKPNFSSWFLK